MDIKNSIKFVEYCVDFLQLHCTVTCTALYKRNLTFLVCDNLEASFSNAYLYKTLKLMITCRACTILCLIHG